MGGGTTHTQRSRDLVRVRDAVRKQQFRPDTKLLNLALIGFDFKSQIAQFARFFQVQFIEYK